MKNKLVVIGLDGGTFDVIGPLVEKGKLPNIARLMSGGVYAELESVIPPTTAPIWASFYTGKNPGKHDLFGFANFLPEGKFFYATNAEIKTKKIWEYLSGSGIKSGWVNLPITYPCDKIDGFMISGMMAPSKEAEFIWPVELRNSIPKKLLDDYQIEIEQPDKKGNEGLLRELVKMVEARARLVLHLLKHEKWQVFGVSFQATDLVGHFYWKYFDKGHLLYDIEESKQWGNAIEKIYTLIDKKVGEILKAVSGANVMLMSDHGMGKVDFMFSLNDWLIKKGYLKLKIKKEGKISREGIVRVLKILGLERLGRLLPEKLRRKIPRKKGFREITDLITTGGIDWRNTTAFGIPSFPMIYVNSKKFKFGSVGDKEHAHVIKCLIKDLKKIKHPLTGRPLKFDIIRREDYSGEYKERAPDITLLIEDGAITNFSAVGHEKIFKRDVIEGRSGKHRVKGIFIAAGPDIKKGKLGKISIMDIAPTILHMFGLAVPRDMDGRVLDLFKKKFRTRFVSDKKRETIKEGIKEAIKEIKF